MESCCKLCLKGYQNTKESRRNLKKNPEIVHKLQSVGINFNDNLHETDTICRKCYRSIEAIAEKDAIRESWVKNNNLKRKKIEYQITVSAVNFI